MIGAYLMLKGINYSLRVDSALVIICVALLVGFVKGRMVLSKSVARIVGHLRAQVAPISWKKAYDRKYYLILAIMMGIGMGLRFVSIPDGVRGFIDVTIGSALINGAVLYFREAVNVRVS